MPYITREDGEHFVIPSYRDVLTVKQKSQLKKEILLLSQSYGEYITLQKKNPTQYEVAFSTDTGYLLGESIWHNFKKPLDLIYCEAIPNTTEAILVIVKSGSVYLDGSFPLDSIPEELIIFLTQQNNFEIYTYGDVPISQEPEAGKFSFEPASVKTFTVLSKPVFPTLALLKPYQLKLVEPVLQEQGIGVYPIKQIALTILAVGVAWFGWNYYQSTKQEAVVPQQQINPYIQYNKLLTSPSPEQEIAAVVDKLQIIAQMPGWVSSDIKYIHGAIITKVKTTGGSLADLFAWAQNNNANLKIEKAGITLSMGVPVSNRPTPTKIYSTPLVIGAVFDRITSVYPDRFIQIGDTAVKGVYKDVLITIRFTNIGPVVLDLMGQQLAGLPIVLHDITLTMDTSLNLNGSITFEALGS